MSFLIVIILGCFSIKKYELEEAIISGRVVHEE